MHRDNGMIDTHARTHAHIHAHTYARTHARTHRPVNESEKLDNGATHTVCVCAHVHMNSVHVYYVLQ